MSVTEPTWAVPPASYLRAALVNAEDSRRYSVDKSGVSVYRLGRLASCDIQIEHQTASRFHAIIAHHRDGGLFIIDQNSANGTFLNGKMIGHSSPVQLREGDVLKFGDCPLEYRVELKDIRENVKRDMILQLAEYSADGEAEPLETTSGLKNNSKRGISGNKERNPEFHNKSVLENNHKRSKFDDSANASTKSSASGVRPSQLQSDPKGFSGRPNQTISHCATGSAVSDIEQKRKMLWGNKAKEESSKNAATWSTLSTALGSSEAQDRFMQLMGGKKPGNEADAACAPVTLGQNYGSMQHELEREFKSALNRTHAHSKHGLG